MPTATNINAAVAALVTLITTQINALPVVADNDLVICEGPPDNYKPNDIIAIAERITPNSHPHAMVGNLTSTNAMFEEFEVSVVVSVFQNVSTAATTRARCFTLVNAVEAAVLGDPTLLGACYMAYPSRGVFQHAFEESHKGRIAEYDLAVICRCVTS